MELKKSRDSGVTYGGREEMEEEGIKKRKGMEQKRRETFKGRKEK